MSHHVCVSQSIVHATLGDRSAPKTRCTRILAGVRRNVPSPHPTPSVYCKALSNAPQQSTFGLAKRISNELCDCFVSFPLSRNLSRMRVPTSREVENSMSIHRRQTLRFRGSPNPRCSQSVKVQKNVWLSETAKCRLDKVSPAGRSERAVTSGKCRETQLARAKSSG